MPKNVALCYGWQSDWLTKILSLRLCDIICSLSMIIAFRPFRTTVRERAHTRPDSKLSSKFLWVLRRDARFLLDYLVETIPVRPGNLVHLRILPIFRIPGGKLEVDNSCNMAIFDEDIGRSQVFLCKFDTVLFRPGVHEHHV